MSKYKRNCKYCGRDIIISNEDDGFFHAFEGMNNDLHFCKTRQWKEKRYQA